MTFLDGNPDLSRTRFAHADLSKARDLLASAIEYHDPEWLVSPAGPLGREWRNGGSTESAAYLIYVAQVLDVVNRGMTRRSDSILARKFRSLLRPPNDRQYEELLTELEFAAILAGRVTPISFEPLASALSGAAVATVDVQAKSPDYAIRLPEGDVCFEVTIIRVGLLDAWDRAAASAADLLKRTICARGLRRTIHFEASLRPGPVDLSPLTAQDVLAEITRSESGALERLLPSGPATLTWGPVPHFSIADSDHSVLPAGVLPPWRTFGDGELQAAAGVTHRPIIDHMEAAEWALRSIRNSLRRKRRQFTGSMPYVLVARLGHNRIVPEGVSALLRHRVFSNDYYRWLTGVILFTPARSWEVSAPYSDLSVHLNDKAAYPAPPSLIDLMADGSAVS